MSHEPAGEALAATTYVLELPAGLDLLNANRQRHRMQKHRIAQTIKDATIIMARAKRIPPMQRAHVVYEYRPPTLAGRRDPGNWADSAKPAVDGLVAAGVLPDDSSKHLVGPDPRLGVPNARKLPQLVLYITPLELED